MLMDVHGSSSGSVHVHGCSLLHQCLLMFMVLIIFYEFPCEFHSKMCYFSGSLEINTPKFRITIFHSRINPCVEMLKWRATRHSKAEKLNFVLRKCKCSLGNSRGLILKSGYHAENPWKTRYFYFEALFGYHKVSWWYPKFSQEKVWYFSFKMTCHTYFLDC